MFEHTNEKYHVDILQSQSVNLLCPICNSQHTNETNFYEHLHIHTKEVRCTMPQSKLKDQENLNGSIARPFKCQQCDVTFDRASQFDYHHRSIHLGEKSQLCEICGKGFFRKTDLRTHLNIHLKTNVCICEVCGRKFNHISNLIRHCRMHKGVKPYPCSVCGKRFTQISSLGKHKRLHERSKESTQKQLCIDVQNVDHTTSKDESIVDNKSNHRKVVKRRHYCKVCGESFSFVFLLRQHEKSHAENTIPLGCKNCRQNFQEIKELEEHVCHGNDTDKIEDKGNNWEDTERKHEVANISDKNQDLDVPETDVIKTVLPLDTIIYITSEQFKKINLEHVEDCTIEMCGKVETTGAAIDKATELNIPEMPISNNCSDTESASDSNLVLYKSTDLEKKNNDLFQETDLPFHSNANEHTGADLICKKDNESSSTQVERNLEGSINASNIGNREEPMLRLVQTETGQQFYEFIISNLGEKLPNVHQSSRNRHDEIANISENICDTSGNAKDPNNEQIQCEPDLQDITDIQSDLNYVQYGLQGEEKNFTVNQTLLGNDPQADFDRYVEANFEVFERLTYENSSERFFEFVEIAEGTPEISTLKESPMVRFVQNEGEQFFELLQDSHTVNKNTSEDFLEIDPTQTNEDICDNAGNEQTLVPCLKEDAKCEVNTNKNCTVISQKKVENEDDAKSICKEETVPQETKKGKIFLIKFQCTVCDKSFSTGYNYKQHIGTHFADQQKFHCKECKLSFAWKSTLNKHIANNHRPDGPQKFACDICPRVYNTLSQVNEHVKRDHLKQRNHICSHCGKSFFKKYDLKIHNRIHTDERPYVCRACGKRFHHRSHIIRHERIHF